MESKILEYLKIPSTVSSGFPQEIKEYVTVVDGMQLIYSETKNEQKKPMLALAITEATRELMRWLKEQKLGIYAEEMVKVEEQNLPKEPEQREEQRPQIQIRARKPEERPKIPKQEPPQMPPQMPPQQQPPQKPEEHKLPTKQEVKATIKLLSKYAKQGDEDAKATVRGLKLLLKNL